MHASTREGSNRKIYALDTNVLIHDPNAVFNFEEHRVLVPMVVLEELDKLKVGSTALAADARHAEALALDRRLVELFPDDGAVRYNLARSLAMVGKASEAIETLRQALALGYSDLAQMAADSDLDSLRGLPAFRGMMADLVSRWQAPP